MARRAADAARIAGLSEEVRRNKELRCTATGTLACIKDILAKAPRLQQEMTRTIFTDALACGCLDPGKAQILGRCLGALGLKGTAVFRGAGRATLKAARKAARKKAALQDLQQLAVNNADAATQARLAAEQAELNRLLAEGAARVHIFAKELRDVGIARGR